MRIDPVLCQKILIAVEEDPMSGSGQFVRPSLDGYGQDAIAHHIKYLWDEKMLTGRDVTHLQSPYPDILIQDITPAGRRFLDALEPEQPRKKVGF
jgi:hypothetical protein